MEQHNKGHEGAEVPITFNSTNDCYRGTIWETDVEHLHYIVLHYNNKYDVEIQCLEIGNIMHVRLAALRGKSIKNPYLKNKFGGFFGDGPYTKHGYPKTYTTWYKILYRLDEDIQKSTSKNAAYAGTTIDENWLNFQVFADWYVNYVSELNPKYFTEYQIDKDILTWDTGIKRYSPETCCIVPEAINLACSNYGRERTVEDLPIGVHCNGTGGKSFSINISMYGKSPYLGTFSTSEEAFKVYKMNKEQYLKELADFYYNENAIKLDVYKALYNIDIKPYANKI